MSQRAGRSVSPQPQPPAKPIAPTSHFSAPARAIVVLLFLIGLACRIPIFQHPHNEGDEHIYLALVENLEAGRGYTLHDHPILDHPGIVREQYDTPLFYHPPAGIALFWLCRRIAGDAGMALAQLIAFTMFYAGMIAIVRLTTGALRPLTALVAAGLAAFHPLPAHVVTRYWLDGPQLGFAALASAAFLAAVSLSPDRENTHTPGVGRLVIWSALAGLMLGLACLTKLNAAILLPALVALAWSLPWRRPHTHLLIASLILLLVTSACVLPWLYCQWRVNGSPFPAWAGRPSPELIRINPFVRWTVTVSPWSYLTQLPKVVWTIIPATLLALLLPFQGPARPRTWRVGLVLIGWIALVLAVHIALGFLGYSRLLRYVILLTPASIALASLVATQMLDLATNRDLLRPDRARAYLLLAVLLLACAVEIAMGVKTLFVDYTHNVLFSFTNYPLM